MDPAQTIPVSVAANAVDFNRRVNNQADEISGATTATLTLPTSRVGEVVAANSSLLMLDAISALLSFGLAQSGALSEHFHLPLILSALNYSREKCQVWPLAR